MFSDRKEGKSHGMLRRNEGVRIERGNEGKIPFQFHFLICSFRFLQYSDSYSHLWLIIIN